MMDAFKPTAWLVPAAMERLTLVLNHVIGSEPAAMDRLRPHAHRVIVLQPQGWPALLPPWPPLGFRITPAGLLEWCGMEPVEASDLRVQLDVSNPGALMVQVASGGTPSVQVDGDAQLAGDVQWLLAHLRWDVAADVERLFGPATAQWVTQWGAWVKRALLSWKSHGTANPGTGPGAEA